MADTPTPTFISCRAYAQRRGVSPMAVSEAIKNGRLSKSVIRVNAAGALDPNGQPKIADPDLADQEWEKNTDIQRRLNAGGGLDVTRAPPALPREFDGGQRLPSLVGAKPPQVRDDEPESVASATERYKAAQADIAELKLAKERGELVEAIKVKSEWANILSQARSKLLAVPTRFKQAVPAATTENVLTLENLIREALEDLVAGET